MRLSRHKREYIYYVRYDSPAYTPIIYKFNKTKTIGYNASASARRFVRLVSSFQLIEKLVSDRWKKVTREAAQTLTTTLRV